jgi:Domain of unknown function (DUF4252)
MVPRKKNENPNKIMRNFIRNSLGAAVLVALTHLTVQAANAPAGYVDFGKLSAGENGAQFVEVNVNSNLIAMVARLTQKSEPDVAELLQGLHSIRVNVIGLNDANRDEIQQRVKSIRSQLDNQGWERIVTAQQKKEDVGVYLKTRGPEAVEGVVVTVLDGRKEAVLINVVGDIKPEKLALLGERFNIDPLKKLGPITEKKAAEKE